jgi:5-methylcytosine-specific restriction protein A
MTWKGNPRTTTPEHRALRLRVLERDGYRCYLCGAHANEVDARICEAEGGRHTDDNCSAICTPCHRRKSAAEGGRAKARKHTTRRPEEKHPGLKTLAGEPLPRFTASTAGTGARTGCIARVMGVRLFEGLPGSAW